MTPDPLTDGDFQLESTSGSDDVVGFAVTRSGTRIGTVALVYPPGRRTPDTASATLRWRLPTELAPHDTARILALALTHAWQALSLHRVETRVAADDHAALRAASVAGMRREGVVRGTVDHVQLARLATDPPADSREGFFAMLNAGLPRKRAIGQGLLRDEAGRFLLCELTYKREWDLPGGVVEVAESPATGLVREIEEELGIAVQVKSLVTVNWLPPWREWDDACLFVFDLGQVPATIVDTMTLQRLEIAAVHWCDLETVRARATAATVELLESVAAGPLPAYRESKA